ncbi:N-acetylglucosamine/diacetylchitobiose ABC transporter substrate-binding protein [Actinophytocola xanthii]|uniref:Carbohydrate ABC transporter, N-acetylglucosamine/diacetylchitobiose-binding protein n=1 Tax=Actinophytocola xanthii TaxID=1912961 RepID=A0A1Q8C5I1_9PSEU|nr:N-acetylglucosamine/diacetylchitobiose ABC transporter substrate-binding protein [Actinophytocola xanthii]OLF09614.1 carbohydrate ABC transporter, N-acetylglucosamine/diacetylchitobiose-binding protein [Actinophytocola xanthii]
MTRIPSGWSRRTFLRSALATGALVVPGSGVLVGCATSGGGQEQTEGEVSDDNPLGVPTDSPLEIYIFNGGFGDKYATDVHEPMYKEKYPNAEIKHKAEVDIAGALQSRFVAGNPPDFVNNSGDGQIPLGQLVSDKQLYSLADLFDAPSWDDPSKKVRDTLVPGAVEEGTFGDTPYALHLALTIYGLWYNKALFDQHGWTPPTTWAEMTDLCKEIKGAGIAPWTYQGVHARYMTWPLLTMAAKHAGEDVLKAIDNLEEGAWAHEAIKESANALAGLKRSGFILEGTEGMDHIQAQGAWCEGKAAFVPCGSWLESEQVDVTPEGFEFAFMPEPVLSEDSALPKETLRATAGEPYVVPAAAKNPRGGLEYMRIMLSKEGARGFTEEVSSLTVVQGAADGLQLKPGLTSAQDALKTAGDNVINWRYQTWYQSMWNPGINAHIGDLLAGRMSVDEFSTACEAEAKKIRDDDSITKYTR